MSRRAPKGMSPCQSCGMSPEGCICPRHVLRGMSLVPPRPPGRSLLPACPPTVTTVTCPQTDIPPAGVLPEGCSHCQHVPRGMSPMSALHYVPRMICLPPPCPKTEAPTAGVTPRGCLCCHHVPKGMYPLPWSVLKGVPPPMCPPCHSCGMSTEGCLHSQPCSVSPEGCAHRRPFQVSLGTGSPEGCPHCWHVLTLPHRLPVSPRLRTPIPKPPRAGQTTIRGPGRKGGEGEGGAGLMQMRVAVN